MSPLLRFLPLAKGFLFYEVFIDSWYFPGFAVQVEEEEENDITLKISECLQILGILNIV
jgi:hypothetical protein